MRKTMIAAVVVSAALLVPAGASMGKGGHKGKVNPTAMCAQERKAAGSDVFEAKYGDPAMPGCKQFVRGLKHSAAKECKQERRSMGRTDFASRYGSNHSKRNAFGKCVSRKVRKAMGTSCPDDEQPGDDEDLGDEDDLGDDVPGDEIGDDTGDELRLGRAYASCDDDPGDEEEDDGDLEDHAPDEDDSDF